MWRNSGHQHHLVVLAAMSKLLLLTSFLAFFGAAHAQKQLNTEHRLSIEKIKTLQKQMIGEDGKVVYDVASLEYIISEAQRLENPEQEAIFLSFLTQLRAEKGEHRASLKNAFEAIELIGSHHLRIEREGKLYSIISNNLRNIGAIESAIKYRKKQWNWQQTYGLPEQEYWTVQMIGNMYTELEEYDSSIVYFKRSLELAEKTENIRLMAGAENDLGVAYAFVGKRKEAIDHHNRALQYFEALGVPERARDRFMVGVVKGNIATQLDNGDPLKGPYLLAAIENTDAYSENNTEVYARLNYVDFLVENRKHEQALHYLKEVDALLASGDYEDAVRLNVYETYLSYFVSTGNTGKAMRYMSKAELLRDSILGMRHINELLRDHTDFELYAIETQLDLERLENKNRKITIEKLEHERELSSLKYFFTITLGVLLLLIAGFVVFKVRSDARKEKERQRLEKKVIQQELDLNTERLKQSVTALNRKKAFASEVVRKINETENISPAEKQSIKLYIENEITIDESSVEFRKFVDAFGKDIELKLKADHPGISENDINMVYYIRMGLSLKQIAIIKNITPESVKIAKNRLRKKLNIASVEELTTYIDSL